MVQFEISRYHNEPKMGIMDQWTLCVTALTLYNDQTLTTEFALSSTYFKVIFFSKRMWRGKEAMTCDPLMKIL